MLIPNTHYEPAHNAAHTYYELGYGHYELYSGSTMSSPYAMRAEPRALAPAAVPLAARYRPARRPPPPRRPALSHSTARRSLQCTASSRSTARHLIARCAARCATRCAAHCAAPLTAPLAVPRSSRRSSRCSLASVRDQRAHMISIQVTLSNAREEAQLWGIAIGRMAGAHLTLVN
jgi:hypothetical protein